MITKENFLIWREKFELEMEEKAAKDLADKLALEKKKGNKGSGNKDKVNDKNRFTGIYMYLCICMHVCMCTCIYICIYVYVCMHVCICSCIFICIYVCVYVCVCMRKIKVTKQVEIKIK